MIDLDAPAMVCTVLVGSCLAGRRNRRAQQTSCRLLWRWLAGQATAVLHHQ